MQEIWIGVGFQKQFKDDNIKRKSPTGHNTIRLICSNIKVTGCLSLSKVSYLPIDRYGSPLQCSFS